MQQQQAQLDQRALHLQKLMEQAPESLRKELADKVELSWIYHESALEGVVYSPDELAQALRGEPPTDPTMVSAFDEIRQNKATIAMIRSWAAAKQSTVDADVVKDIYASLAPDEVDGKKPPAYRKDIPLHRLYFHEIAAPDKIIPKLKAFGQWINATDTRRTTHVLRLAAKAHFHLLHIYPYPKHSGKVARLVMNLLLLSSGYPPAVLHSTERQRYYDALKTNENALAQIVKEALTASIESSIRFLESRLPPPAPPPIKKIKLISRRRSEPPPKAVPASEARSESERPAAKAPSQAPKTLLASAALASKTLASKTLASKTLASKVLASKASKALEAAPVPAKPAAKSPSAKPPSGVEPKVAAAKAPSKPPIAKTPVAKPAAKPAMTKTPAAKPAKTPAKAPTTKPAKVVARTAKPAPKAKPAAKPAKAAAKPKAKPVKVASLSKARKPAAAARPKPKAKVAKPKARRAA